MKCAAIVAIGFLTLISVCQAEMTLQWEVNLADHVGSFSYPGQIKQYVDGSVAVIANDHLVALKPSGDLKLADPIPSSMSAEEFTGHAGLPNTIFLSCYDFNADKQYIRIYEISEGSFSVTNLLAGNVSMDSSSGLNSSYFFIAEGTMLQKYSISTSLPQTSGAVSSGITGSNYVLNWDSFLDSSYQIQSSVNLTNWVDVGGIITGTGSTLSWANALTNSSSFYRVIEH